MNAAENTLERLTRASQACSRALQEPPFTEIVPQLGSYAEPAAAFALLSQVTSRDSGPKLSALCSSASLASDANLAERALLLLAAQYAAAQVPSLPVAERVKELFADEFEFYAHPTPAWIPNFRNDSVRFRSMARITTLRRFPAGQHQWEVSGLPRSWVFQSREVFRLLRHILLKMGGFSPLFEVHVSSRHKIMLVEKEACLSYYRVAKSLEKQPKIKGIIQAAWLYGESTAQVSPHLSWLRSVPQNGGALVVDLGFCTEADGFLVGSADRRKLYENGTYRPRLGCVLWARQDIIEWANRHPEFDV